MPADVSGEELANGSSQRPADDFLEERPEKRRGGLPLLIAFLAVGLLASVLFTQLSWRGAERNATAERAWRNILSAEILLGNLSTDFYQAVADARLFLVSKADVDLDAYRRDRDDTYRDLHAFEVEISVVELRNVFDVAGFEAMRRDIEFKFAYLQSALDMRAVSNAPASVILAKTNLPDPYADIQTRIENWNRRMDDVVTLKTAALGRGNREAWAETLIGIVAAILFFLAASILAAVALARSRNLAIELESQARRLARAERSKAEFLANMSHEIRTPMNAILGFAELIRGDCEEKNRMKAWVDGIATSGHVLLALINDILDLSRLEAERMKLHRAPIAIAPLVNEVKMVFGPQLEKKGLYFRLETLGDIEGAYLLDEIRVRQILFNLVGNSVKFTHEGGVIVRAIVAPTKSGGDKVSIRFDVSDTGIGIAAGELERIFEPFRQSESGQSRHYGGTGIGLSICRKLAEAMGGSVAVESVAGQGSTFSVSLPEVQRENRREGFATRGVEAKPESTVLAFEPADVLLVEDDPFSREVSRTFLEQGGLRVEEADNGRLALEVFKKRAFALVIMDLSLPLLSGQDLVRAIRKEKGGSVCPIIILTGSMNPAEASPVLASLVQAILLKPLGRSELLGEIARHLPSRLLGAVATPKVSAQNAPVPTIDAFAAELEAVSGQGSLSKLGTAWESEVAPSLAETGKTFSLLATDRAAKAIAKLGKERDMQSLVQLGIRLEAAAAFVDVASIKSCVSEARLVEEMLRKRVEGLAE